VSGSGSRPVRLAGVGAGVAALAGLVTLLVLPRSTGSGTASVPVVASSSASASASTTAATATATQGPGGPASVGLAGAWTQVFHDGFSGDALSGSSWVTCYDWNNQGCTNAGNHELEWYQPGQVGVSGGTLTLTALRQPTTAPGGTVYPWTSGMVSTGRETKSLPPRRTFTYGFFSARIKVPAQLGMFPAFWLMPQTGSSPPELDVVEFNGNEQTALMTVHWASASGADEFSQGLYGPEDFPAGFHEFAVDWEPDAITWYIDGVARRTFTDRALIPTVPMEMLFTLAVGFPDAPPADVSRAAMQIQDVQVWQR
jgi:beta-glucanase (GH16 family)